jgi:hypothetical protein
LAAKKKAAAPEDHGIQTDDPDYQKPAFASAEELAVLDQGVDKRLAALLKDHKRMGAR